MVPLPVDPTCYDALTPSELRRRGTLKWNQFDPDVLAMWVAEMDFPTAPAVVAAAAAAVAREEFGYPSQPSAARLAGALSGFSSRRYGWPVPAERVHLLPDVLRGVELAVDCYTAPGSPVVLPTPAYMPFFEVATVTHRPLVEVPMLLEAGRHRLDLEGIDRAFGAGAGSVILCQPYNPLGRRFRAEELVALSEVVAAHGGRVVADEIHGPLTYGERHVPYASVSAAAASHAVTVTSASKPFNLPGLKCAAAITSNDADEERFRQISPSGPRGPRPSGSPPTPRPSSPGRTGSRGPSPTSRGTGASSASSSASCSPRSATSRPRRPTSPGSTSARSASRRRRPTSSSPGPGSP